MELIRRHQLNIMLVLSGICAITAVFAALSKVLPKRRRLSLVYMEVVSCILLFADRLAYLYRGNTTPEGYWVVRITNFLVYFLTLAEVHAMNLYLSDVAKKEMGLEATPRRLITAEFMVTIGWIMLILSQFTGFYYAFDENNLYQRGPGFMLCYVFPLIVMTMQISVTVQYRKRIANLLFVSIMLFTVVPVVACVLQVFFYGISFTNMTIVGMSVLLYIFALVEMNKTVERANRTELERLKEQQQVMRRLFDQTATMISTIIDSKDRITPGHSRRVATYAKEMASRNGMDERTCDRVYFTAMLHDIGKLELPDELVVKETELTEEERELMRSHTVLGGDLLAMISEVPNLSDGARYHRERYDGKGYPQGLSGDDIPEVARIIAVADAYDSMTSRVGKREPLPQRTVREQLVKDAGGRFDPKYAKTMISMIDGDAEYMMRDAVESDERGDGMDLTRDSEMHFDEYREQVTDGIRLSDETTKIRFTAQPDEGYDAKISIPALILFDSIDGRIHRDDRGVRILNYVEYGEIWMDGHTVSGASRNLKMTVTEKEDAAPASDAGDVSYEIEAVRYKDHVRIIAETATRQLQCIVALPDSGNGACIAISGEHCSIRGITVETGGLKVDENVIPRIVDEISYINRIVGDVPNVQVDGNRSATSENFAVEDGMRLAFRSSSLPTSHLLWHCPYVLLYASADGQIDGEDYKEFACVRLDGEDATKDGVARNELSVRKNDDFEDWEVWKAANKRGISCELRFRRRRNRVIMTTVCAGIEIKNVTYIPENAGDVRVALTGDRCALTDIRVM